MTLQEKIRSLQAKGISNDDIVEGMRRSRLAPKVSQAREMGATNDDIITAILNRTPESRVDFETPEELEQKLKQEDQDRGMVQNFIIGMGSGFNRTAQGAAQLAGKAIGADEFTKNLQERILSDETVARRLKENLGGRFGINPASVGELVGEALAVIGPTLGLGAGATVATRGSQALGNIAKTASNVAERLPKTSRIFGQASAGGAAAATQPVLDDENFAKDKKIQIGIGAVGGLVIPATFELAAKALVGLKNFGLKVINKLGEIIQDANPSKKILTVDQSLTPEGAQLLDDVLQKQGLDIKDKLTPDDLEQFNKIAFASKRGGLTEEETAKAARASLFGVRPLEGNLKNSRLIQSETEAIKKIPPDPLDPKAPATQIFNAEDTNQSNLVEALQDVRPKLKQSEFEIGKEVSSDIIGKRTQQRAESSSLFEEGKAARGINQFLKVAKPKESVDDIFNEFSDVVPAKIKTKLTSLGLRDKQAAKKLTLNEARRTLNLINNELSKGNIGDKTKLALNDLKFVFDSMVESAKLGGNEAARIFKQASALSAKTFNEFKPLVLQNIVRGKVDSEVIAKQALTASVEATRALKQSLTTGTKEQIAKGKKSFDGLSASVFAQIVRKSLVQNKTEKSRFIVSPSKLEKALDDIGPEKLKLFFTDNEIATIRTIQKVAEDQLPIRSTLNPSGTASALLTSLGRTFGGPRLSTKRRAIREFFKSKINDLKTAKLSVRAQEIVDPVGKAIKDTDFKKTNKVSRSKLLGVLGGLTAQ